MLRYRAAVALLAVLAIQACTGYSASHGPRPVEPGKGVFAVGASAIVDTGDDAPLWLPELSYRHGLTDWLDAGLEVAGGSVMVDGLAALWDDGTRVLSLGLGASYTVGATLPTLHPELYFGSESLFVAARPMVLLTDPRQDDDDPEHLPRAGLWPGLSLGTTLGRTECIHLLPTATAFFDESTVLVLTLNLRLPHGYDCR